MASTDPDTHDVRALADLGITHAASDAEAADRIRARLHQRGRGSSWRRGLAVAVIALVGVGSATAAAVTVVTRDSGPAHGPIPPVVEGAASTSEYAVRLEPYLEVGRTGWCSIDQIIENGALWVGGEGCGPAATHAHRVLSAGGTMTTDPTRRSVILIVVDDSVAAIRSGGERVIPRADDVLQPGMRLAVLTPLVSNDDVRGRGAPPFEFELEGADGRVVSSADLPDGFAPDLAAVAGDGGPCPIELSPDDAANASGAQHVEGPLRPVADLIGRPFLTCAAVTVRKGHPDAVKVALLLDGADPGTRAADIPGARPVPGTEGVVRINSRTMARRAGNGWLVARGNLEDAMRVLAGASAG